MFNSSNFRYIGAKKSRLLTIPKSLKKIFPGKKSSKKSPLQTNINNNKGEVRFRQSQSDSKLYPKNYNKRYHVEKGLCFP